MIEMVRAARIPTALLLLLGATLLLARGWFIDVPAARAAETVVVSVADFAYAPGTVTIHVGDTVTWHNGDGVDHTATSDAGTPAAFDVPLPAGDEGSVTFSVAGTYTYFCTPHPFMTGTVIVEAAAGGPPVTATPDAAMAPRDLMPALALLAALLLAISGLLVLSLRRREGG